MCFRFSCCIELTWPHSLFSVLSLAVMRNKCFMEKCKNPLGALLEPLATSSLRTGINVEP